MESHLYSQRPGPYPNPFENSTFYHLLLMSLAMQQQVPVTKNSFRLDYDYIVVGSGSGGSVTASRLAEYTRKKVLLLEVGKIQPLLIDLPAAQSSFEGTDVFWNYKTEPQKYAALRHVDRRVPTASGKILGGSSTDNSMFYMRGNRADYKYWESLGAKGWNWNNIFPYFLKAENNTDPDIAYNGYHGVKGPLTVGRYGYYSEFHAALKNAAKDMKYAFHDINGRRQTGFADIQGCLRQGQRCSVAKAYLVPNENRTNFDIVTEAFVTKVIIENKIAKGVLVEYKGSTYVVKARCEVIISAGSIRTPQLLMLSGIGPRKTLEKFGIPVKADLPVGKNYHDPAGTVLSFVSTKKRPTFQEKLKDDKNILQYIKNRTGPLASIAGIFGVAFLTDNPIDKSKDLPNYWLFFLESSWGKDAPFGLSQKVYDELIGPYINKPVIQCIAQDPFPQSRGYITLKSTNPHDDPLINPNYYADQRDLDRIVIGMKACFRIMENRFMKKLGYKPFDTKMPGCEGISNFHKYLECYARSCLVPTYHQVGSAKMGRVSDPNTVVDPELRVKGIQNLRIVDSSVIPQQPRGGTHVPVVMIAERISKLISKCKC